jgi:hypothetical protein
VSLTRSRSRVRSPPLISSSFSLSRFLILPPFRPILYTSFHTLAAHKCVDCQPVGGPRRLSTWVRMTRPDWLETGSIPSATGIDCRVLAFGSELTVVRTRRVCACFMLADGRVYGIWIGERKLSGKLCRCGLCVRVCVFVFDGQLGRVVKAID